MLQDKLNRIERRRLESVAQAISMSSHPIDFDQMLARANEIEKYITSDEPDAEGLIHTADTLHKALRSVQKMTGSNNEIAQEIITNLLNDGFYIREKAPTDG